jgi:FtsZ-binding cell division protein ZapB
VEIDVEQENFPQQFEKLEARIEQLVETCGQLQTAKNNLEKKVEQLEDALKEKNETERSYREEKSIIRSKVDSLIGRLDKVLESA